MRRQVGIYCRLVLLWGWKWRHCELFRKIMV